MEIVFIRWEPPRIIRRSLTEAADEKFIELRAIRGYEEEEEEDQEKTLDYTLHP